MKLIIKTIFFALLCLTILVDIILADETAENSRLLLNPEGVYVLHGWKFCTGDKPGFAEKNFEDEACEKRTFISKNSADSSILWFRKKLTITKAPEETEVLSVLTIGLADAFEVYWDGLVIGTNGNMPEKSKEYLSGQIVNFIKLKPQLTKPGDHVLAFRVANNFPRYQIARQNIYIGYHSNLTRSVNRQLSVLDYMTGINTMVVILTISLFLVGGRHRSYLYFGLYRLCFMIYAVLQIAIFRFPFSMKYNDLLIIAKYIFDPIAYIFLSLFIIYNFSLPRKKLHLIFNLLFFSLFYSLWGSDYTMLLLLYPLGMMTWAVKNKKPGSVLAFIGLAVLCATSFITFFKPMWYEMIGGNIVFVSFALLSIGRQVRAQENVFQESQLKSSRLEAQLLKKNIQPHFLMNTLLTIISLIKKKPDDAIKLIQALAEEFKMINKISSNKVIPIQEEIVLCRKHLEIMGYRCMAQYELVAEGIPENEKVPPMIFHTLIENGITHSYEAYENGTFYLSCRIDNKNIHYVLKNSGTKIDEIPKEGAVSFEEGLGTRYVKARLDESFPGNWEMSCGQNNGFWEVKIVLTNQRSNGID